MQTQVDYRSWRDRANAYLALTNAGADRWSLSYVLATLRHSGMGQRLWNEARDHGFWQPQPN